MAGRIENGIILNGIKYEAVEARNDDDTIYKGSINCKKLRLVETRKTLLTETRNSGSIPPRS